MRRSTIDTSRFRRLSKEGSWIVAGQIVSVVGGLFLVRVLTEYLDPAEYGKLMLGMTAAILVNQLVMGPVGNGIGRFYSIAAEKNDLLGYFHDSKRLMAYATLVVVLLSGGVIVALFVFGHTQWAQILSIVILFSILGGFNSAINGVQTAARQRAIVAFHAGLDSWLKILLAMGAMILLGATSIAVVIGYSVSILIVTFSQLFFLGRTIPIGVGSETKESGKPWLGQMFRYSWPFSAWGIFTWMQQVSDRWSLEVYTTTEEVGLYAAVFQLGYMPISILLGLVMTFLGPILYQRSGDASDELRNKTVHLLCWRITMTAIFVTGVGFLVTFFLNKWLFGFLVSSEYREASYLLPWIVIAGGFFSAGQMLSVKLMSELKSLSLLKPKLITAISGMIFNIVGAMVAGMDGVVVALVGFSTMYLVWMLVLGHSGGRLLSSK